jgi:methyl-accepting chemotaxis protein
MIETNFGEIDAAMGQSTREASSASQAATATSSNVQMMTSAAEELAASVSEMAQSMATSRVATDIAFAEAKSANEYTNKPSSAAEAMGGIISLIQNIAGQINLLALNATFESARAGEAGPYRRRSELCLRPPTRRRTPHVCLRGGDLRIQEQGRGFIR